LNLGPLYLARPPMNDKPQSVAAESATNRVHKEPNWNGDHVERVVNVIDKI